MLPETFSLKDIEILWTYTDKAPDKDVSKPYFR